MQQEIWSSKVSKTFNEPLVARYKEMKKHPSLFQDKMLNKIGDSLGLGTQKILPSIRYGVTVKTLCIDKQVQSFINKNPEGVIVSLGCGMDTRYFRLHNTKRTIWYDIDFPEAIALKKKFIESSSSYIFIAKSILDYSWIRQIKKNVPVLFVAETVLMYLQEKEIKQLFQEIHKNFPRAELLFDVVSPYVVKHSHLNPQLKSLGLTFTWGLQDSYVLEKWIKGIKLLKEWTMKDILRIYSFSSLFYAFLIYITGGKKVRILYLRLE